jgi:hypothetical protein
MFNKLYSAGLRFGENTLQKAILSKTMTPDEKKEASGFLGLAVGSLLENIGYGGMFVTLVAAAIIGFSTAGGLPVATLVGGLAIGTAFAGIGTFGIGVKNGGDKNCGVLTFSRELNRSFRKEIMNTLFHRGSKPEAETETPAVFKAEAKPAAESFSQAVQPEKAPAAIAAVPAATVSAPEMK